MSIRLRHLAADHVGLAYLRRGGWTHEQFGAAVAAIDAMAAACPAVGEGTRGRLLADELLQLMRAEAARRPRRGDTSPQLDLSTWGPMAEELPARFERLAEALHGPARGRVARVRAVAPEPVEALIEMVEDWLPARADEKLKELPRVYKLAMLTLGDLATPESVAALLSWLVEWDHLHESAKDAETNVLRVSLRQAGRRVVAPLRVLWSDLSPYQRLVALMDAKVPEDDVLELAVQWLDAASDVYGAFGPLEILGRCGNAKALAIVRQHLNRCLDAGNFGMAFDAADALTVDFGVALDETHAARLQALRAAEVPCRDLPGVN